MKRCSACNVKIKDETLLCPLCSSALETLQDQTHPPAYPQLVVKPASYRFITRLLIFISILTAVFSAFLNFILDPSFLWCLLIITGIVYSWLAVSNALRRNDNPAFKILVQVLCASGLTIALDFQTGAHGWALSFAVPGILCFGITAVIIIIIFNRTNWAKYVLYQWLLALFGFAPLILYFFHLSNSLAMCLATSALAFASLLATIVFGDKTIKNEMKRRLHF